MENCPHCGQPMEESHVCAPATPVADDSAVTEEAAPEMGGEEAPAEEGGDSAAM